MPAIARWKAAAVIFPDVLLAAGPGEKPPREPLGLPPIEWPRDNPYSASKVELGRYLYFDKRLSADETISCATCHDPQHGFTDGAAVSTGISKQTGTRSAPTVINRAFSLAQFWDGRAATLEERVKGPIGNPIEMGNSHEMVVSVIRGILVTAPYFQKRSAAKRSISTGLRWPLPLSNERSFRVMLLMTVIKKATRRP